MPIFTASASPIARAEQRAGHDVARVVHAEVGPRQRHRAGGRVERRRRQDAAQSAPRGRRTRSRRGPRGRSSREIVGVSGGQVRPELGPRPAHDLLDGGVGDAARRARPSRGRRAVAAPVERSPARRARSQSSPCSPARASSRAARSTRRRVAARAQQSQQPRSSAASTRRALEADPLLFGVDAARRRPARGRSRPSESWRLQLVPAVAAVLGRAPCAASS